MYREIKQVVSEYESQFVWEHTAEDEVLVRYSREGQAFALFMGTDIIRAQRKALRRAAVIQAMSDLRSKILRYKAMRAEAALLLSLAELRLSKVTGLLYRATTYREQGGRV